MFSINSFIDTVQIQKKWFVNAYFTDPFVKNELVDFVDKQTAFVKQAYKASELVYNHYLHTLKGK